MPLPSRNFAWCFDHGGLHNWHGKNPWCTALWVSLKGDNEQAALTEKAKQFGDARFIDQLPFDQQSDLILSVDTMCPACRQDCGKSCRFCGHCAHFRRENNDN